jgi:Uri superfamily endonuclease
MAQANGDLSCDLGSYSGPGLYALGLRLGQSVTLAIGALGRHLLPAGAYVYVGSAWGPGGLAARVGRHLRSAPNAHWHVDYLRAAANPIALWLGPGEREECIWATRVLAHPAAQVIVPGFGSSDCNCPAHLACLGPTLPVELLPSDHFYRLEKG